jgi:hypothetical protein
MRFQLSFACDNAAFEDALREHVATLLRGVADRIDNGSEDTGWIYDGNGNRVGAWSFDNV